MRRFPLPGKRSSVIFFLFVNTTSIQQYLAAPLCFIDQSRDTILKEKMLPYSQQPFIPKRMQLWPVTLYPSPQVCRKIAGVAWRRNYFFIKNVSSCTRSIIRCTGNKKYWRWILKGENDVLGTHHPCNNKKVKYDKRSTRDLKTPLLSTEQKAGQKKKWVRDIEELKNYI